MIKNWEGKKVTPKQKAQELLFDAIDKMVDYTPESEFEGCTEKEQKAIVEQITKYANRISKQMLDGKYKF